jgi:hypothetical protein
MSLTCAEGNSGRRCCAKQEHLIAVTKIKHFNQTQAVFKKLIYFPEPTIFTEVWNLALKTGWTISSGCGIEANHTRSSHKKHPDPKGMGQSEQEWLQRSLRCQQGR